MNSKLQEKMYREKLEFAPVGLRILAYMIDVLLVSFVIRLIYFDIAPKSQDMVEAYTFVMQTLSSFICLYLAYEVLFIFFYGASLGKIICKIKVIDVSTLDVPNLWQICLRSVFKFLGIVLFYAPFFSVFFLDSRQALHDLIAKSIVIKNA